MAKQETFYDSLDEDEFEEDSAIAKKISEELEEIAEDLTKIVPLYRGEIPKNKISQSTKTKIDKIAKPINIFTGYTTKKSYLSMYYEKINRLEGKLSNGSNTTRAVCENLSPKRESDLELPVSPCESVPGSDHEDFYEKFMALDMKNKQSKMEDKKQKLNASLQSTKRLSSQSCLVLKQSTERPFYLGPCVGDNREKLEILRKRLSYGTKMSMKNRIKMEELKNLKRIKNSALGRKS